MGRLDAIRTAERPKMHGRAMLSGPSGAGKTWTALSMARTLVDGDMSSVLAIDTERESMLTYADVFPGFAHLPWRAPYDPGELTEALTSIGNSYGAVIVDTFSKFWRGKGGTLDIADGKFGGWKTARPVQESLVEAVLSVPAHVILCVRSKTEYLVENGGAKVTKLGLAPIQDDELVYEMNIALDIDLEHRITVTKSRTPAVPVGRMYPAGLEKKAAEDYDEWLAGGIPPANRDDVERVVERFADISDADRRKVVKHDFVQMFGMPHSLTAAQMPDAMAWLEQQLGDDDNDPPAPPAGDTTPNQGDGNDGATTAGMPGQAAAAEPGEVPAQTPPAGDAPEPEPATTAGPPQPEDQGAAASPPADGPSFTDRVNALPADLGQDVRTGEKAIRDRGVEIRSAEHIAETIKLLEAAEKKQNKRATDVVLAINGGANVAWGRPATDDERHQLLLTFTTGSVASAKRVTAEQLKAIKRHVRDWQNGGLVIEQLDGGEYSIREAVAS